jgi:hypothetical protein
LPFVGMFSFICSATALGIHAHALSEPLFAFCTLSGFALLLKYNQTGSRVTLIASSFIIGWAFLTRYVGVVGFLVGLIVILIHEKHSLKKLIPTFTVFSLIACFPMALWTVRNTILYGKPTSRSVCWHPPDLRTLNILKTTLMTWVDPYSPSWLLRNGITVISSWLLRDITVVVTLSFIVAVLAKWITWQRIGCTKSDSDKSTNLFQSLCFIFIFLYCSLLLVVMTFFGNGITSDEEITPDERIMFPVFFIGLMIIINIAGKVWLNTNKNWYGKVIPILLSLFILNHTLMSGLWSYAAQKHGLGGYNSPVWKTSQTLLFLRNNNIDASKIITNDPDAIYLYTGKSALSLPKMYYTDYIESNSCIKVGDNIFDYDAEWDKFHRRVDKDAIMIYFVDPIYKPEREHASFPSEDNLVKKLGLAKLAIFQDSTVYFVSGVIN